jgi:16S rRNA (cytosine1402-N4)-methyltransferase
VLLDALLDVLAPRLDDTVVDVTVGFAGHARVLLERVGPGGRLIALDWDAGNLAGAREALARVGFPFACHHANFAALPTILATQGVTAVDALVADLGMSSMQVDDPERGFSYVRDGPLDMRMDRSRGKTAAQLLATMAEQDLAYALRELGDEDQSERIAAALIRARAQAPLLRTGELAHIVAEAVGKPADRNAGWRLHPSRDSWDRHPAARSFQALRILVNRELANLQQLLRVLPACLRPGGRAAIISFHSGEDRLVKDALREGLRSGVYREVADKPVRADAKERFANPRSRSAKLRWAIRAL